MNRSYDTLVDNGLFVLAYYLDKTTDEITYKDIEDTVESMSARVERFLDCEKYSNLKSMFLFNSAVSNPSLKHVKLEEHLKLFLQNKGNEYCMLCGEKHANTNMSLKGRSYLPNRPSATYFNFANNLHNINVCPYCIVLTTYSVMNCRVNNNVYTYNSSEDDFMIEFTEKLQKENEQDIILKASRKKDGKSRIDTLLEMIDYDIKFDFPVEVYRFSNGKTEDIPETEQIYSENVKLLRSLRNKSLLEEFRALNLTRIITENKLQLNYFKYIYDFQKNELKCSTDLLNFLNQEVNTLDEYTIALIERISNDIKDSKLDIKKLRNKLKAINSIRDFDNTVMEMQELYYESTGNRLFDNKEYNELTNKMKYIKIRNMFLTALI